MIEHINEIPTLPQITMELMKLAFEEEPDIGRISDIIEKDAALTAKLIKTVNSAAFGLKAEVKSIQQSVSLLGLEALRATVVAIALGDFFINNFQDKTLNIKSYCSHSLSTAVIMEETAKALEIDKGRELYMLGLLHDMGTLILDMTPDKSYEEVLKLAAKGKNILDAEEEVYGWNSDRAWLEVAQRWEFPSKMIGLYKGSLEGKVDIKTNDLIESCSRMADKLGYYLIKPTDNEMEAKDDVFKLLTENVLMEICGSVKKQGEAMGELLGLPAPDREQTQMLFLKTTHQLSKINADYESVCKELEFRVEVLEELTRTFTGIIKSLDSESLTFSVLEALKEGFKADGVFMLIRKGENGLVGYSASENGEDDTKIDKVQMSLEEIAPELKERIYNREPFKIDHHLTCHALDRCLDAYPLAWIAPIYIKDHLTCIIGLGVKDKENRKFKNSDFGKIIKILSGEISLSIENTRLYNRMRVQAITDPLTKINNRRTVMKILSSEFSRFKRNGTPLSMAILDMDNFKSVNDRRGHLAGDDYLVKVSIALKNSARESDYVGRYGGDEFMALFPDTAPDKAVIIAERIRKKLLEVCAGFQGPDLGKKLSVSVGVAGALDDMKEAKEIVDLADSALYQAKEQGRNRCILLEKTHSL